MSPGFERVQVHEVAHVVGQEDGGPVHARPHRLGVVAHGHVELGVVRPLLDRGAQVDGRDGQDARELAGLDSRELAGGPVAGLGDLGHGGVLAGDEHGLGVALVGLMGVGVAGREDRREEEHHADQGGAQSPGVLEGRHGLVSGAGCHCSERDSAIPSRAARSIGSRCICFLPLQILRRSFSLCCSRPGWRSIPASAYRYLFGWSVVLPKAAAGPAPETGGGTEEVPEAGPGGSRRRQFRGCSGGG